jgi:hypothetical protein
MRRTLIVAALALLAITGSALATDTTRGTAEADALTGTPGADAIFARAGNDTVDAAGGDDRVRGGQGDDTLSGEDGNDLVNGGGGEDTIDGGAGDDVINARGDGRAADEVTCGEGADTVRAGRDDDVAEDCETVKQPGKPKADDDDEAEETAPAEKQQPFAEDGKPGKGPKAAATAVEDTTPAETAKAACKTEKHETGTQVFKRTYAAKSTSKAMQACIAKREPAVEDATDNAAQECKAERTADPAAFSEKYGTNKNKKNAYGKCVSGKAQEATEEETEARVNAAKTCKALRAEDKTAFEAEYGAKKNAFGKCVSATAKTDEAA